LTKRAVASSLQPGERRAIVPYLLSLTDVRNTHGAMGLFGDNPMLLIGLAIGVLGILALLLGRSLRAEPLVQAGYGMVAGGAIGNVVDRIVHGYVLDFIALPRFYVFNVADACITTGLILMAIPSLRQARR